MKTTEIIFNEALKQLLLSKEEEGYSDGFLQGIKEGRKQLKQEQKEKGRVVKNNKIYIHMNDWLLDCSIRFNFEASNIKEKLFELGFIGKEKDKYIYDDGEFTIEAHNEVYISLDITMLIEMNFTENRLKFKTKEFSNSLRKLQRLIEENPQQLIYDMSNANAKAHSPMFEELRNSKRINNNNIELTGDDR